MKKTLIGNGPIFVANLKNTQGTDSGGDEHPYNYALELGNSVVELRKSCADLAVGVAPPGPALMYLQYALAGLPNPGLRLGHVTTQDTQDATGIDKSHGILTGLQCVTQRTEGQQRTGEFGAGMLQRAGANFVITGHSERRKFGPETNHFVRKSVEAALRAEVTAIVCIGETLEEREDSLTQIVLETQLQWALKNVGGVTPKNTIIAYEPCWAIGTGKSAEPEDIRRAHAWARAYLASIIEDGASTKILYGGSVKPENAEGIMELEGVDGGLIGGASQDSRKFSATIESGIRGWSKKG